MSPVSTVLSLGWDVLIPAALVILFVAFFRAWRDVRRPKVVISPFTDATGDETVKGAALGLTHRLREETLEALPRLAGRMTQEVVDAKSDPTSPVALLGREDVAVEQRRLMDDIGSSEQTLTQSIDSMVPESARGATRVVTAMMLRPRGVRVSGMFQKVNDAPGSLGISVTVEELQGRGVPARVTLWEDGDTDTSGKTVLERFHDLVVPASRALACELLRQHLGARIRRRRVPSWFPFPRRSQPEACEGVIEFVIGTAYLSAAARYAPAKKAFYQQAERALRGASKLEHYWVSCVLAEAVVQRARSEPEDEAETSFEEAIDLLGEAGQRLPKAPLGDHHRYGAELNIKAGLALIDCLLVPREPSRAERTAAAVIELYEADTSSFEGTESTPDTTVLYNLASTLAVASALEPLARHGVDLERCQARAKECLLQACLGNDQWWTDGKVNRDLAGLRGWLLDARREVLAKRRDGSLDREAICAIVARAVEPVQSGPKEADRSSSKRGDRRARRTSPPRPVITAGSASAAGGGRRGSAGA
jgi:hypothetical protein